MSPVGILATLQRIVKRRGLRSLYAGLSADTLSTLLSSFIYFFTYAALHKGAMAQRRRRAKAPVPLNAVLGPFQELVIGVTAGVVSKSITLPISAVSVRQQISDDHPSPSSDQKATQPHKSKTITETLRQMIKEDGVLGLFSALPPSIPLALLPSLTLYTNALLVRLLVPARYRAHPRGSVTFLLAALSNAIATLPLYPLILFKVLGQSGVGRKTVRGKRTGLMDTLDELMFREGPAGLYKGLEGQLLKGFVSQGVMMLVKQRQVMSPQSNSQQSHPLTPRVEELVIRIHKSRL